MIEKGGIYKLKKIKDFFGNNTEDDFQVLKMVDDTVYCKNLTTDEVFMVNKNDLIDPEYPDDIYSNFEIIQEGKYKMSIKNLIEGLERVLESWEWEYVGDGSIESVIGWLYTHNVNLTKKQYYAIDDLRDYLKGEKELSADEIESIIYFLQHNNKNYRSGQEKLINELDVTQFIDRVPNEDILY